MRSSKTMAAVVIFLAVNLVTYVFFEKKPEILITNNYQSAGQLQAPPPVSPTPVQSPQGVQLVKSLLGLEVKFLNGSVNYPGLTIVNDPRYQALAPNEKLVDALRFQPLQAPAYFLLIAIAKNSNGAPLIVPGKFNLVQTTQHGGLVLKDLHERLFYYSGYITLTPAWKNLAAGQAIEDQFCKTSTQMAMCSPQNLVKVILKKPMDTSKDIPFLTLVR
jgi:hypothetical protein